MAKRGITSGHFVVFYHTVLAACLGVYLYFRTPSVAMLVLMVAIFPICGLGITGAYHRYYAHRSYKLNKAVEAVLLLLGTWAVHGSVLRWAHDHRMHHWHTDTEKDPYSISKGFWHAHFWWMFRPDGEINAQVADDLLKNPLVRWQHKYHFPLMIFLNAVSTLFFGWLLNDYAGAFVFTFLGRMFITHHATWFVNSLAHSWGSKEYSREQSAVNSWIVALVALGEGYHNYHHTFPNDYRNGVKWYQFDPTKWCVWALSKVGLAWDLNAVDEVVVKKRLLAEDEKTLRQRLAPSEWTRVSALAQRLRERLSDKQVLMHNYRLCKQQRAHEIAKTIKEDISWLKKCLKEDYAAWSKMYQEARVTS